MIKEEIYELAEKYAGLIGVNFKGRVDRKIKRELEDFVIAESRRRKSETRSKEETREFALMRRKFLRECGSPIEAYLEAGLKTSDIQEPYKTQLKIGWCQVDFAFPKKRLVVECDGYQWHKYDEEQIEKDQKRDKYLARKRWRVIHLDGIDIRRDINGCIRRIKRAL